MKLIYKNNYKPGFWGYRASLALVKIIDGIVGLIVAPFGYSSNILTAYAIWNVRKDAARIHAQGTKLKPGGSK